MNTSCNTVDNRPTPPFSSISWAFIEGGSNTGFIVNRMWLATPTVGGMSLRIRVDDCFLSCYHYKRKLQNVTISLLRYII